MQQLAKDILTICDQILPFAKDRDSKCEEIENILREEFPRDLYGNVIVIDVNPFDFGFYVSINDYYDSINVSYSDGVWVCGEVFSLSRNKCAPDSDLVNIAQKISNKLNGKE